jgi:hypothetical protein
MQDRVPSSLIERSGHVGNEDVDEIQGMKNGSHRTKNNNSEPTVGGTTTINMPIIYIR